MLPLKIKIKKISFNETKLIKRARKLAFVSITSGSTYNVDTMKCIQQKEGKMKTKIGLKNVGLISS